MFFVKQLVHTAHTFPHHTRINRYGYFMLRLLKWAFQNNLMKKYSLLLFCGESVQAVLMAQSPDAKDIWCKLTLLGLARLKGSANHSFINELDLFFLKELRMTWS